MIPLLLFLLAASDGEGTAPDSARAPDARIETIAYSTDSLVFEPETGDLLMMGTGRVDYRDMTLFADTIRYFPESELVMAGGECQLLDRGETIRGTAMIYDLDTRKGRIVAAASQYEFGFYTGESVTRVGREEFNIVDARFTTCELEEPHYWFFSPVMKVFPDDKAVARPVYMYVDDTPVFYFPWWVFPIRRGRSPGFTIPKIGETSRDGRYLRDVGYYFVFSDYADLYIHGDIMEKTRFVLGARERHRLRYVHHGQVETEWRREFEDKRDRWMVMARHLHEFPDGTSVRVQGEFLSDRSYLEETQQTPEDRMTGEARSWLSVSRYIGRASLQATLDRTQYLDVDPDTIPDQLESTQELPDIRVTLPSTPLFETPADPSMIRPWHSLYWSGRLRYLSTDEEREDSRTTHSGLRGQLQLSGSSRLWGILSFSPSVDLTGTVYDRDTTGDEYPWWLYGRGSVSLSTDLYGVFGTGMLGLQALRHTITPSATLTISPDRLLDDRGFVDADSAALRYYSFSGFGLPAPGRTLSLSLLNRLEGKRVSGSNIERFEIAVLTLSTSVDLEGGEAPFSPLSASLELSPVTDFSVRANGSYDLYGEGLQSMSISTSLRLSGFDRTLLPDTGSVSRGLPVRLTLSHYYRLGLDGDDDTSKLRLGTSLDVTPGWSVDYNAYYDIIEGGFISQSYGLRRDLHCWEAVFERQVSGVDSGFYFRINIKDLPDIKVEQHVSNF